MSHDYLLPFSDPKILMIIVSEYSGFNVRDYFKLSLMYDRWLPLIRMLIIVVESLGLKTDIYLCSLQQYWNSCCTTLECGSSCWCVVNPSTTSHLMWLICSCYATSILSTYRGIGSILGHFSLAYTCVMPLSTICALQRGAAVTAFGCLLRHTKHPPAFLRICLNSSGSVTVLYNTEEC